MTLLYVALVSILSHMFVKYPANKQLHWKACGHRNFVTLCIQAEKWTRYHSIAMFGDASIQMDNDKILIPV